MAERILEGRRSVEAVGSSVALEDGGILRGPFDLLQTGLFSRERFEGAVGLWPPKVQNSHLTN